MVSAAVVVNRSGILTLADFPELPIRGEGDIRTAQIHDSGQFSLHMLFPSFPTMAQVEKVMLKEAYKVTGKKQGAAADLLGLCRQTVKKKMLEIEADRREAERRQGARRMENDYLWKQ